MAIAASRVVALKKASNRKKSLKQAMKESPEEDAEMTEAKSPRRGEIFFDDSSSRRRATVGVASVTPAMKPPAIEPSLTSPTFQVPNPVATVDDCLKIVQVLNLR
jgi:hypothetical protein